MHQPNILPLLLITLLVSFGLQRIGVLVTHSYWSYVVTIPLSIYIGYILGHTARKW